jgi:lipid-A-disaccharide synthase
MPHRPPTIFISAAEDSGDEHASNLIRAIRRRRGDVRLVGVGGAKMAAAGCELLADLTGKASMAGGPVLQLGYWYRTVRRLQKTIRQLRPDLHIPVDSPALNWHLAAAAKESGARVFYYIAPQVWAWAPWRARKLARLTDHVACILPFEQPYLRHRGVHATYVGHPLFDTLPGRPDPLPDLADAWANGTWKVALLAGSRPAEIRGHATTFLEAASQIRRRLGGWSFTFAARSHPAADAIRSACAGEEVDVVVGRTRQVLAESHFALAVSGTITLELAHFGVPMVIVYKAGRLGYNLVGRWMLRTPHLSLVNILAGRRLVPELMPWHGSGRQVIDMAMEVMDDLGWLFETRKALMELTDGLHAGPPQTASDNAAALALETAIR